MSAYLSQYAKKLRRKSIRAEALLWSRLRSKQMNGIKFRRQQPVAKFIVDFVSFDKRIIIELDGGQHASEDVKAKDDKRDRFLSENGFKVLRFWDNEVFENLEGVLETIRVECV